MQPFGGKKANIKSYIYQYCVFVASDVRFYQRSVTIEALHSVNS